MLLINTKSLKFKTEFAKKTIGKLIIKLSLNAVVSLKFLNKKLEIVNPDLDNPGIVAIPCAIPRKTPSVLFR